MFRAPISDWWRRLLSRNIKVIAQNHVERGNALCASGKHARGLAAYQRAIDADPAHAEAHYRAGLAWRDQQQLVDAIASYGRALALKPDYIEAHNNLGVVLQLDNDLEGALACFQRAVDLNPEFSQPYINLGRLCESLGDRNTAVRCYRKAIAAGVEIETFQHLLNAAEGVTTDRAPAAYARTVFDNFATHFDQRLVDELGYRIPEILCARVIEMCGKSDIEVLDLGCGTGLCGPHLKPACSLLVGVDVSSAMLAEAAKNKLYDILVEQDIVAYLVTAEPATFNAVLAADVFIYLGELNTVFTNVARVLKAGGVFAFSIERAADDCDYIVQPSGRYVQSAAYIKRIAEASGLAETLSFKQTIRGAPGHEVPGLVFFLRKNA